MITRNVEIFSVTQFERENKHIRLQWPERFVAITMLADNGDIFVTFTRKHAKFADNVKVGDKLTVTGRVKRTQEHGEFNDTQTVLTNCVIGVPLYIQREQERLNKE